MLNKLIKFEIVTPERVVLKEQVSQVSVPTKQGEITVLFGHIPLVAGLIPGVIEIVKENGNSEIMFVSGGFIEVLKEKIVILADIAERAEEIDIDRVEEAKKRAEKIKKDSRHFDKERFANISASIAKELARTKAVKRWKKINTEARIKN
ncbi:MAG: ATP synthase F1 subunit epsilon [Patescibacteria group bacterium]|nr:ATP synthase F1 subunit epsilon [Patescibacteria group bacterium]